MAKFIKSQSGAGYLRISYKEYKTFSNNPAPECAICPRSLTFSNDIIMIPLYNKAYCYECGMIEVNMADTSIENATILEKREQAYKDFFIKKGE